MSLLTSSLDYEASLRARYPNLYDIPPERKPTMRVLSTPSIVSRILGELAAASRRDDKPQAILLTPAEMDELLRSHNSSPHLGGTGVSSNPNDYDTMKTIELYRRAQPYRFAPLYTFQGVPLCVTQTPSEFSLTR